MPYCTLDDIKKSVSEAAIVQLTDDDGLGVVDQDKVDAGVAYADQLIDGYIRGRYTLPLQPVPALIIQLSVDLAIFHLYGRRFDVELPKGITERYSNAVSMLKQIQKGQLTLDVDAADSSVSGVFKTNKTAEDRVFGKETLDTY